MKIGLKEEAVMDEIILENRFKQFKDFHEIEEEPVKKEKKRRKKSVNE